MREHARKLLDKRGLRTSSKCPFCEGIGWNDELNLICYCVLAKGDQAPSVKDADDFMEAMREYKRQLARSK